MTRTTTTRTLCSRCERFDTQAFGRSRYPYRRLPLSAAVQSAERGCSFCSLLVENLATMYQIDQSWLGRTFTPLYIQLQACRDNNERSVEDGGMAIYQIAALVVMGGAVTAVDVQLSQLGLDHIEINVAADQGKRYVPGTRTQPSPPDENPC